MHYTFYDMRQINSEIFILYTIFNQNIHLFFSKFSNNLV